MAELSSEVLYSRFRDGDEQALAALIRLYEGELLHYITGIVKNPSDADELLTESFVNLGMSQARFDSPAALKSYLFIIGKNLALKRLKQNERRGKANYPIDELIMSIATDSTPETDALREERQGQLMSAMGKLKAVHRDALRFVYFENASYQYAADLMGKTPRQVEGIIYRAKSALRKKLNSEGFEYADF